MEKKVLLKGTRWSDHYVARNADALAKRTKRPSEFLRILSRVDRWFLFVKVIGNRSALAYTAAAILAVTTFIQLSVDLWDRQGERRERKQDEIAGAWEQVLSKGSGDTGRGASLNILIREKERLEEADFSCRAIGAWDQDKCIGHPVFYGVDFQLRPWDTTGRNGPAFFTKFAKMHQVDIIASDLSFAPLSSTSFSGSNITSSVLRNASIRIEKTNAFVIDDSDLKYAHLDVPSLSFIGGSNLSKTTIELGMDDKIEISPPIDRRATANWFWADEPPTIEGEGQKRYRELIEEAQFEICNPERRMPEPEWYEAYYREPAVKKDRLGETYPTYIEDADESTMVGCKIIDLTTAKELFPKAYTFLTD